MPKSYGTIGVYIASPDDISSISLENEIFLLRGSAINTVENNLAYNLFQQESDKTGFIPGVTNRK